MFSNRLNNVLDMLGCESQDEWVLTLNTGDIVGIAYHHTNECLIGRVDTRIDDDTLFVEILYSKEMFPEGSKEGKKHRRKVFCMASCEEMGNFAVFGILVPIEYVAMLNNDRTRLATEKAVEDMAKRLWREITPEMRKLARKKYNLPSKPPFPNNLYNPLCVYLNDLQREKDIKDARKENPANP